MADRTTRRALIGSIGLATGSFALGRLLPGVAAKAADAPPTSHWAYHPLDAEAVAAKAYALYPEGSCMVAVFGAVMNSLAEQHGEPYASFPCQMMAYGHGGVAGWGTLCGTLNGAAAIMGLFVAEKTERDLMIDDLFDWYRSTALPLYKPGGDEKPFLARRPISVLCHISSSTWAEKAKVSVTDPLRRERCRRLCADVAARSVMLLNDHLDGKVPAKRPLSAADQGEDAITKMQCVLCHAPQG